MKVISFFLLSFLCLAFLISVSSRAQGAQNLYSLTSLVPHTEKKIQKLKELQNVKKLNSYTLAESVDLRAYDSPIKDQGSQPYCTAYALASTIENFLNQRDINKTLSSIHLWSLYRQYDSDAAIKAAQKNYLLEYAFWPDQSGKPNVSNPAESATVKVKSMIHHEYNLQGALEGLNRGHSIYTAIRVPTDLASCKSNIRSNSPRTRRGHHVVEAVGYQLDQTVAGGGYLILKNSWGKDCGDQGYHYYPFALCQRSDLYCYFMEVTEVEVK